MYDWLLWSLFVINILGFGLVLYFQYRSSQVAKLPPEVSNHIAVVKSALERFERVLGDELRNSREEARETFSGHAKVQENRLTALQTMLSDNLSEFRKGQSEELSSMRREASDGREKLEKAIKINSDDFSRNQTDQLGKMNNSMKELSSSLQESQNKSRLDLQNSIEKFEKKIEALTESNSAKQDALKKELADNMKVLREENTAKLDQMRQTVDEKLQGTLDKRLGESFKLVSERLEEVHKGLGEMQNLATGVGDLKRVLTNVKSRGGWGEVQLEMLLEDMLTPDQYEKNVRIRPQSSEAVEFAVKLPGKADDARVYLPIDCKFPHEDYDRLISAHDSGDKSEIERAGAALERAIKLQAKTIKDKYVCPPHSTDFAIMYLPTEGLFAEVARRPGLTSSLQNELRIMVTGPTTLVSLLSSLQMGFKTLAIEKRSSEVWQVLAAAKLEFQKYGDAWDRLGKQLDTARKTVDQVGTRTRAVTRTLKKVETLEPSEGKIFSLLEGGEDDAEQDFGDEPSEEIGIDQ